MIGMKIIVMTVLTATAVFTTSCMHTQVSRADWFGSYGKLLPPKDGQVQVCLTQDVKREGVFWIKAGSGIDEIEQRVKPEWAQSKPRVAQLTIFRLADGERMHELRYN